LGLLTASCNRGAGNGTANDPTLTLVLQPWGDIRQSAFPGDEVDLKVLLLKSAGKEIANATDLLPAAGEALSWRLLGTPPGTPSLSATASIADAEGISFITVDVGATPQTIQIEAAAAGTEPVTFTVVVAAESYRLEMVSSTAVSTAINRTERLRVRLIRDTVGGGPVADRTLHVEFQGGVRPNGARLEPDPGDVATITTDAMGVAAVRFKTGSTPSIDSYKVLFCQNGSCPNTVGITVPITVTNGMGGDECQYFTDCQSGFICDDGTCIAASNYCDSDANCPTGYHCNTATRLCDLNSCSESCYNNLDCQGGKICGSAGCCIPPGGCTSTSDCPDGWSCEPQSGACLPPTNVPPMNVSGTWYTRYHFDISDTLPGFLTDFLGPAIDFLNLVFAGQLEIDIPIIGDILEGLIDQVVAEYVPSWAQTLVKILADFIHLFENMEARGVLQLTQEPVAPLGTNINGVEDWSSAQFFVVSLCPGGPSEFADNPECGRIDVAFDPTVDVDYSNDDLRVGIEVAPFRGEVMGRTLLLKPRNVKFGLAQLVNVMLDVITAAASDGEYGDFETYLLEGIDCAGIQASFNDLIYNITDGDVPELPGVEAACNAASLAAIQSLHDVLGNVELQMLELGFDQRALIYDNPVGGLADQLGDPTDPTDNAESALIGDTDFAFFGGELDDNSWWYGTRLEE